MAQLGACVHPAQTARPAPPLPASAPLCRPACCASCSPVGPQMRAPPGALTPPGLRQAHSEPRTGGARQAAGPARPTACCCCPDPGCSADPPPCLCCPLVRTHPRASRPQHRPCPRLLHRQARHHGRPPASPACPAPPTSPSRAPPAPWQRLPHPCPGTLQAARTQACAQAAWGCAGQRSAATVMARPGRLGCGPGHRRQQCVAQHGLCGPGDCG